MLIKFIVWAIGMMFACDGARRVDDEPNCTTRGPIYELCIGGGVALVGDVLFCHDAAWEIASGLGLITGLSISFSVIGLVVSVAIAAAYIFLLPNIAPSEPTT